MYLLAIMGLLSFLFVASVYRGAIGQAPPVPVGAASR